MSVNSLQQNQANSYNMQLGLGTTQSSALGKSPLGMDPTKLGNVLSSIGDMLNAMTPMLLTMLQRTPMQTTPLAGGFGGYPFAQQPMPGLQQRPQMYMPQTMPQMYAPQTMPHTYAPTTGMPTNPAFNPALNPMLQNPMLQNPLGQLQQMLQVLANGGMPNGAGLPNAFQPNAPQTNIYGQAPNVQTTVAPTGETKFDASGNVQMDKDRAFREVARNFDQLTKGKDNYITKDDLKAIAEGRLQDHQKSANYTPELRAAAKYLLDNPDAMKELETSDAKAQGFKGKADGKIGKGDTTAAMQRTSFSVGEKEALQTVAKYGDELFHGRKTVSLEDMQKIAKEGKMPDGKPAPADLRDAAKLLVSQPETFGKLDNAKRIRHDHRGDQHGDGKFSMTDLREALKGADTKPGPDGVQGGIFGAVRSDSVFGRILKEINDEMPRISPQTKSDIQTTFQGVPSDIRLY